MFVNSYGRRTKLCLNPYSHIAEIRSKNSGNGHVVSKNERVLGVGVYTHARRALTSD